MEHRRAGAFIGSPAWRSLLLGDHRARTQLRLAVARRRSHLWSCSPIIGAAGRLHTPRSPFTAYSMQDMAFMSLWVARLPTLRCRGKYWAEEVTHGPKWEEVGRDKWVALDAPPSRRACLAG